jgi:hypothetical protein
MRQVEEKNKKERKTCAPHKEERVSTKKYEKCGSEPDADL